MKIVVDNTYSLASCHYLCGLIVSVRTLFSGDTKNNLIKRSQGLDPIHFNATCFSLVVELILFMLNWK